MHEQSDIRLSDPRDIPLLRTTEDLSSKGPAAVGVALESAAALSENSDHIGVSDRLKDEPSLYSASLTHLSDPRLTNTVVILRFYHCRRNTPQWPYKGGNFGVAILVWESHIPFYCPIRARFSKVCKNTTEYSTFLQNVQF